MMVSTCGKNLTNMHPSASWKYSSYGLIGQGHYFQSPPTTASKVVWCYSIICCFSAKSKWWNHILPLVMMQWQEHSVSAIVKKHFLAEVQAPPPASNEPSKGKPSSNPNSPPFSELCSALFWSLLPFFSPIMHWFSVMSQLVFPLFTLIEAVHGQLLWGWS